MKKFAIPFLFAACLFLASCSNDDEPKAPVNAITLNMMNSDNGKTTIGGSDVYINSSNNFVSSQCGIVDLGRKGSLTANPSLSQIAQEVAVTPGNYYQIVLARDVQIIAGERAFPINTNYYCVRVDSWLYDADSEISGAKVRYAECFPTISIEVLPEWDTLFPAYLNYNDGMQVANDTHTFAKGVKIDPNYEVYDFNQYTHSSLYNNLKIKIQDNKITFSNPVYSKGDKVEVITYVRYGSLYTRVHFIVS
ncbi:MAG: DUF5036 family protein [Muribaculaceae bacterium]|nr:DUF5036 family protein [Muribaculaceae bacterium]